MCDSGVTLFVENLMVDSYVYCKGSLPGDIASALFRYRHEVFVKRLGWTIPDVDEDMESDAYDRDDTVYVIARDECGSVCGCARLLPTTHPYMLREVFPYLLSGGTPFPQSPDIWELSRFAATDRLAGQSPAVGARRGVGPVLSSVIECAAALGARQLVMVAGVSIERLGRRIGVRIRRAGPAQLVGKEMVAAYWIDVDHAKAILRNDCAGSTDSEKAKDRMAYAKMDSSHTIVANPDWPTDSAR